jgi:peptidoglycan hydrolase-like protein with peptidoglycan-binding domain
MSTWRIVAAASVVVMFGIGPGLAHADVEVQRAQKALKQSGHDPGPIDGVNGPRTTSALKAYQQANGLEATGQLDDATRAKLGEPAKSASKTQAGGDARPSPADPAQATKTGGNAGEGASYSRSTQK